MMYGQTLKSLEKSRAQIVITISGTDETVAYTIHARHMFSPSEILWDHQFVDMFYKFPNGDRYLNYAYFHEVVPRGMVRPALNIPLEKYIG